MYKRVTAEDSLSRLESTFAGLNTARISCILSGPSGTHALATVEFEYTAHLDHSGQAKHDMSGFNIPLIEVRDPLQYGQVIVGKHTTDSTGNHFYEWSPVYAVVANFIDMVKSGYTVGEIEQLVLPIEHRVFHRRLMQWIACSTLLCYHGLTEEALKITTRGRNVFNAEVNDRVIRNICQAYNHEFWDMYVSEVDKGGIHSSTVPPTTDRESLESRRGRTAMGRPVAFNAFKSGDLDKIQIA